MTCGMDDFLGAYVLDALEPAEAEAVRAHLAVCDTCRDEVAGLSATASMLALLTAEEAGRLASDEQESERAPVRAASRPRRIALAIAAAAVIATATAGGVHGIGIGPAYPAPSVVRAVAPATQVRAAVVVTPREQGAELRLSLSGAYPSGRCSLLAHSADGRTEFAARWVADASGAAEVDATTAIPPRQLTSLDVVTDAGVRLVRITMPHTHP
jgi:hypothetical protein